MNFTVFPALFSDCFSFCFFAQFFSISRSIYSGEKLRVDFVGRLESLSEEWARLQPAREKHARKLSPRERRALVLPRARVKAEDVKEAPHHRVSTEETSSVLVPFSTSERFSLLHVILTCRRYIQDLVCFDMRVPRVCIDHAELVLDLDSEPGG